MTRDEKILSLRGKLSFSLIAEKLGITRNVVAGVMFRANWPRHLRIDVGDGNYNRSGTGHHGGGAYAKKRRPMGPPAREASP